MSEDLIFIITRCVRKEEHNRLFKECYKCIRNHYDNPIYIIDDNSDQKVLEDYPMSGVEIIQSEFPGAGEILPLKKNALIQVECTINTYISERTSRIIYMYIL